MTPQFSPATQAVLNAADDAIANWPPARWEEALAAALRAAVKQCTYRDAWEDKFLSAERILAIADELDPQ